MPHVKGRNVRIEEAENGFIVRTEKKIELSEGDKSAEAVMFPRWENEEHVATDFAAASKIASDFMEAKASGE